MLSFITKLFDYNEKQIQKLKSIVQSINNLENKAHKLKNDDFKKEVTIIKEKLLNKESLDIHLPWVFAMIREASNQILGQRHFDEQLMAGIVLHQGNIAEQKTGEGKTLSATAPILLNALTGKGVHVVTVNDYLARRDAGWMAPLYYVFGLTTAAIISDESYIYDPQYIDEQVTDWRLSHLKPVTRKEAYMADITYGINSEFGFDYLRDNMCQTKDDLTQRNFHYAIIDEVDSVLIDEARTPHIISAPYDQDVSSYYEYARIVDKISEDDYVLDEKLKTAHLTDKGIQTIEKMLNKPNIYETDYDSIFHIEAALKARTLFKKDKDYIVKDNEIVIVDEFTGRLLQGRRFSEGIHQAIEAKESVEIKQESKTLATVSLQNYFRMYEKLAGMTGTAVTEAEEFHKIYKLNVVVLPTHQAIIRQDEPDLIYKTEHGKFEAVVEEVALNYKLGRPVLVGTTSIEKNEYLSNSLKKRGIPHELLNAKNHEREATIIADAGKKGAITIATNMAGRGVDIVLGGSTPSKANIKTKKDESIYEKEMMVWQKAHEEVVSIGGLYVIGTERHESRRIDNQLRGRSGRLGDPGKTRFFVSLQDDMMRIFGGEQVAKLMNFFNIPEDQPLEHALVTKALEQAQVKVEGHNFDIRKHLVEYDDVLNKQREIFYSRRMSILQSDLKDKSKLHNRLKEIFEEEIIQLLNVFLYQDKIDYKALSEELAGIFPYSANLLQKELEKINIKDAIKDFIDKEFITITTKNKKSIGFELWNQYMQYVMLTSMDKFWTDHLTAIDDVREGIGLRGYGQLDPLTEYKNEAFAMFERLLSDVNYEVVRRTLKVTLKVENTQEQLSDTDASDKNLVYKEASSIDPYSTPVQKTKKQNTNNNDLAVNQQEAQEGYRVIPPSERTSSRKLGRNDKCWCGSGKKYKKCHYPN